MSSQSWELKNGATLLGVVSLTEIDQPWFRCEFTPSKGWGEVEYLFQEQADAVDSGDQQRMMEAIGAVRNLQLKLQSQAGDDEVITPIMIQIRGNKANFRY
ncbi:hypothetical protein EAO75_30195 [Streptomyces sp. uw30]|uniref:hypothetical protein n=1 Tax=Streptomyces sp. uw30 TaxID=1828179 RepID=UPI0011CEAA33|nr:hypothetical protein [Streptomyces sp. uw30]TXS44079.1 hypothetical protein EAO75_30195 [Streptomyces sp. uw30]